MSGQPKFQVRKGNRFAARKNPEIQNSALETGAPKGPKPAFLPESPISAVYFGAQTPGNTGTFPHADTVSEDRDWGAGAGGFEPPYGGIKIRCLTAWRRPNFCRGGTSRSAPDHNWRASSPQPRERPAIYSLRKATSSIRCVMPLVKTRLARGRVGRMFSLRLRRFVRVQMPSAVSSASLSERSANLRK
jgi:hypothetical protein